MAHRVVVTGIGVVSPLGHTKEAFWQKLCHGQSGIGPITHFDASDYPTRFAGEVKGFEPERYLDKKQLRRMDLFTQYAVAAADMAIVDAGLDLTQENGDRIGVVIGSGIGGIHTFEQQHTNLMEKGPGRISPFFIPMMIVDMAPGQVSMHFGLKGPNYTTVSACSSGANAIADAFRILQRGEADIMITGGAEASVSPMAIGGFCAMKALSTRNDDPQAASRPFDRDRDGFVLGEGAGLVVLETLQHARGRDAPIYAEMVGCGCTADAYHITEPAPNGEGALRSMCMALADARLNPQDIDSINAHGTSTPLGDRAETMAIKAVFGDHARRLAISSTKSMIGHLLGASGGVEFVATILSLFYQTVHPTINYQTPDPECDLDYVPNVAREQPVRGALSNSFGFGGHNVSLVVKRYTG